MAKNKSSKEQAGTPPAAGGAYGDTWKDASKAEVWQPEAAGDTLEGKYLGAGNFISKKFGKKQFIYRVMTDKDVRVVFGSARLDRSMENIPVGSMIKITYQGKIKAAKEGQQPSHDWRVLYKPALF